MLDVDEVVRQDCDIEVWPEFSLLRWLGNEYLLTYILPGDIKFLMVHSLSYYI
jgi:hypothetical protein